MKFIAKYKNIIITVNSSSASTEATFEIENNPLTGKLKPSEGIPLQVWNISVKHPTRLKFSFKYVTWLQCLGKEILQDLQQSQSNGAEMRLLQQVWATDFDNIRSTFGL